jgi:hypothetical protein
MGCDCISEVDSCQLNSCLQQFISAQSAQSAGKYFPIQRNPRNLRENISKSAKSAKSAGKYFQIREIREIRGRISLYLTQSARNPQRLSSFLALGNLFCPPNFPTDFIYSKQAPVLSLDIFKGFKIFPDIKSL